MVIEMKETMEKTAEVQSNELLPHKILTEVRDEELPAIVKYLFAEDWEKVEEEAFLASIRLMQLATHARGEQLKLKKEKKK